MTQKTKYNSLEASLVNQLDKKNGVFCQNVYLSYSSNGDMILNGVNLNVEKGEIYSLLGPSGCGKTTLLRCIVGIKKPNYGTIRLFQKIPNDKSLKIPGFNVGYMPQEFALYKDLTIYEMLVYMAKIFQMKTDLINQRIYELINLLNLPEPSRYIKNLSGGQKRRVSFAATIIHKPKLIILDEPTAGVDPLLREKIWLTLIKMKEDFAITFIITTHYIEESRRAEKIAFMRKGQILCQDKPYILMNKYNSLTLENVFLKICTTKKKSNNLIQQDLIHIKKTYQNYNKWETYFRKKKKKNSIYKLYNSNFDINLLIKIVKTHFNFINFNSKKKQNIKINFNLFNLKDIVIWLNILFALIKKNLIQDLRDPLQISFQYFSPIFQILLFALCIGRNPIGIELGVYSKEFSFLNFSSKYLDVIDNEFIHLNYYTNYTKALEDVKKTKLWGIIYFNNYFSHAFLERFAHNVSNSAIKNSTILINSDFSNKIVNDLTFKELTKCYFKFIQKEFDKFYINSEYVLSYIKYPEIIFGKINDLHYTGFRNFMVPGIIINLTFAMAIAITSMTLINETNAQTMERNYVSGVNSSQMIIAHIISRIILSLPYVFLIFLLPITIFKLPQNGNLLNAIFIILSQNIFGMICGLIVACLSNSLIMSMVATSGSFMITLFVSGTLWPIEAIPIKLKWFSYILPTTLATEALRSITLRGWSIQNYYVWTSFVLSFIWIFILSLIGFRLFKINQ